MCIFIYFGYAPPPNTGSVCVWNRILWNAKKWTKLWWLLRHQEASGRHKCLFFCKRPWSEVLPCSASEASSWNWAWALAGLLEGFETEQSGLRMSASWWSSELRRQDRRQGAWACYPGALWSGPFPRGAWNLGAKAFPRRGRRWSLGRPPRRGNMCGLCALGLQRMRGLRGRQPTVQLKARVLKRL